MPLSLRTKTKKSLLAQGIPYQILFSFKQDDSKQIFKALRRDPYTGIQQEMLLKIFLKGNKSYQEEFESLSQVVSPYCVRLLGFESFGDKKALILEYIKGVSLFQLIENFSLRPKEIDHILISIYKGLEDLNKQGLCHGDLSLDNVLIDEKAHIKLIDFGKANYNRDIQGTPPFLAPEILKGARVHFPSDLYSLGVIDTLLRTPCSLSSLEDIKPEDFDGSNPLLSPDPANRFFPYKTQNPTIAVRDLKSLSYKVKDLLSFIESRRCPTLKNPHTESHSSLALVKNMLLTFILAFAGGASSQALSSHGWVKVYTNEWFTVRMGGFESYTPLSLPLKPGWHSIKWKSKKLQGTKKIFVSNGKSLFLNDQSFLTKGAIPD